MNACVQVEIEYNSSIPDGLVASLERIADKHQVKLTVTSSRRLPHTSDHPPSAQSVVHVSQPRLRVTSSSSSDCQPAAKKRKV